MLHVKKLKPLFSYAPDFSLWYAQSIEDGSIHFLNPYLLQYFLDYGVDSGYDPEFSYAVATNVIEFVALCDQELIPVKFYEKYNKSLKIVNFSGFDIYNIHRKVFIKPLFFAYNKTKQEYEMITSEQSALNFADKVRPNETIETCIKRIVRDELKIADDYYRAKVTHKIDFDRDKEGILTPRLWICIYLQTVNENQEIKEKSQRGWTSFEKN